MSTKKANINVFNSSADDDRFNIRITKYRNQSLIICAKVSILNDYDDDQSKEFNEHSMTAQQLYNFRMYLEEVQNKLDNETSKYYKSE